MNMKLSEVLKKKQLPPIKVIAVQSLITYPQKDFPS